VGLILGVDGGNSKTDAVLAEADGTPLAYVRGPGSNSHGPGESAACVGVVATLVERLAFEPPAERGTFFLCGADLPRDLSDLRRLLDDRAWAREAVVDNDTFGLLHAGTDRPDAVAVVCGSGINCVGRNASGAVARYPALGWETGDWGGGEELGREALALANRAADGRGAPTALLDAVEAHFGKPPVEVGIDVHYATMPWPRLGELAPAVVELAREGDAAAAALVERLADEIVLLVERALRDLALSDADVVLGGGMLAGRGHLYDRVAARLPTEPLVPELPPVAGAVLASLAPAAAQSFRADFAGWEPQ
jgi:N-acetylglucosamine kinase-like BadF-type ATPase